MVRSVTGTKRGARGVRLLAGVLAWCALAGGGTAAAADVTLRMHQFLPAQANVPMHILDVWADRVEEASEGRIEIQRFPSMQLGGKPPELVDQVVDGVADIIWTVAGYTPGRFPRAEVFELPFIMSDAESTSRAFWTLAEETMLDQDFRDLHVLGLWVHGPGVIHSKEPVESVEDLGGVKLRAPTRLTTQLFEALGATSIGMPVPAVPEALSKGVIDATVIPWEVTTALKVAELVDNHTVFGDAALYTTTFLFAMNKAKLRGPSRRSEGGRRRELRAGVLGLRRAHDAGVRRAGPGARRGARQQRHRAVRGAGRRVAGGGRRDRR